MITTIHIKTIAEKIFILTFSLLIFWKGSLMGQGLSEPEISFLSKNIHTICTDKIIPNADWKPIAEAIKDKKMIFLGEPNHGSREIFELRNGLIQFLHDKAGFNTVLFESGIGELIQPDLERRNLTAAQMTNGFFGGWRTSEFRNLMNYIKSENISIAGFDVQRTGNSFITVLNASAGNTDIDSVFYNSLEERYGLLQRKLSNRHVVYDSVSAPVLQLINDYQHAYDLFSKNTNNNTSKAFLFILRTFINRIKYLQYMLQFVKDKDWHKRWAARDVAMAENIRWLLEHIYKDEKVIIVAHNYHIARRNESKKVMGQLLSENYSKQMYAVGMFAGSGIYADNSGKATEMTAPDSTALDIKHIINRLPGFISFLDMPKGKSNGSDWLHSKIVVNDTFIDLRESNTMVLAKQFDGLIFIRSISIPEK